MWNRLKSGDPSSAVVQCIIRFIDITANRKIWPLARKAFVIHDHCNLRGMQ